MTGTADLDHPQDGALNLELAERQAAMLAELAQMAMAVSRGYAAAALAAANAVEVILDDEIWQPETGRARALAGARDAADSFQKVSRALRLTLMLERTVAEWLRDLRAGVAVAGPKPARQSPIIQPASEALDEQRTDSASETNPRRAETERLREAERLDRLPSAVFRETVDQLCADIGAAPDWKHWRIGRPKLAYEPLTARPAGWSECDPATMRRASDLPGARDLASALPP